MMPASMTPPNTSFAISTRNFPVSDNIVSLRSFLIDANVAKKIGNYVLNIQKLGISVRATWRFLFAFLYGEKRLPDAG